MQLGFHDVVCRVVGVCSDKCNVADLTGTLVGREEVVDAVRVFGERHNLGVPQVFRCGREISARAGNVLVRASRADPDPSVRFVAAAVAQGVPVMGVVIPPEHVEGWWVTGWEWLRAERDATSCDVASLAALLERTEPVDGLRYSDQVVRIREYLGLAKETFERPGTQGLKRLHDRIITLVEQVEGDYVDCVNTRKRVLWHGDLSPSNIVVVGDTPTLVDPDVMGVGATGWDVTRVAAGELLGVAASEVREAWNTYWDGGGVHTPETLRVDTYVFLLRRVAWHLWITTNYPPGSADHINLKSLVRQQLTQIDALIQQH